MVVVAVGLLTFGDPFEDKDTAIAAMKGECIVHDFPCARIIFIWRLQEKAATLLHPQSIFLTGIVHTSHLSDRPE